jgi:spore germination cell wall hydrolase CwlJ-like protein
MFARLVTFFILMLLLMGVCAAESQRDVVAMTILGEARGEGKAGMYAVATVINQRAINRNKTPKAVCLKAWQFSCWNKNDPNRKKLPTLLKTHPMRHYAITLAQNIMKLDRSYTKNADHYINKHSRKPSWLRGAKPVRVIGNHAFYKLSK